MQATLSLPACLSRTRDTLQDSGRDSGWTLGVSITALSHFIAALSGLSELSTDVCEA